MAGIVLVVIGLAAAAGGGAAEDHGIVDFAFGPGYARNDSLEVLRPVRVVVTGELVPARLFLDLDAAAPLALVNRPAGGPGWKFVGDIVPAAAGALWFAGCDALLAEGTTAYKIAAAPAAVLALSVVQPQLRWHPARAVGLQAGWSSEWLLFHDEAGYTWRPGVGIAVRPVGTLVLEGGLNRNLFWSFAGRSGDWGWGWYAGVRVRPELQ